MMFDRRRWMKLTAGAGAGAALGAVGLNGQKVQAETSKEKLEGASEFTTACNFCSCGCGMICHVKDGKLINLEGDPDHIINEGALCSKGAAMVATHTSEQRLKTPLYRTPGSDKWQEISWEEAIDKVAGKIKQLRDDHWIANEMDGKNSYTVNRTDAIGMMGGAQNTNEECYVITKMARLLGTVQVEHQARL
jgi:formate dehydrogenase major subunit